MRRRLNVVFALGIVIAVATAVLAPPYLADHRKYADSREEGRNLVRAVYRYKEKTGTWPAAMSDLVPDFLPAVPQSWHYQPQDTNSPPSLKTLAAFHTYLCYYFPPTHDPAFPPGVEAGWLRDSEGQMTYLEGE